MSRTLSQLKQSHPIVITVAFISLISLASATSAQSAVHGAANERPGRVDYSAAASTLNLSRDLVRLGIAAQNLTPNDPSLDAGPLFQAAIQYIQNNPVQVLTVDPGSYYVLTSQTQGQYLIFESITDLTVDFQGSSVFFQQGLLRGFDVSDCQRFTLENVTIDSLVPRFTQVQLTAVDPANGILSYALLPGWADPATFTNSVFGTPQLYALIFRDGTEIPGTGLTYLNYPVTSPALTLVPNGPPWQQSGTLSTLMPGDTIVVEDRSGAEAISVENGDSITLSNIEIHGTGGGFAVQVGQSSNSTAENIRITPRPGALVASNADGIHFTGSLRNNHIRNCYVRGTMDDALAMDSEYIATIVSQPGPRQLTVTRQDSIRFPNGSEVNFVGTATGVEQAGATIVSQDPPDSVNVGFFDQVNLTFDRDLPPTTLGDGLVFGAPDMRGSGSSIEDNLVEDSFGRGMFLGGLENVVIQRNVIRRLSNAGINVSQVTVPNGGSGVPSHGISIQSNSIQDVLGPAATGAGGAFATQAAIIVDSSDPNFDFITSPVNSNISIVNNYVAGSGRAGIWIGELDTGQVSNNVIVRWNQFPELPVWGDNPFPGDFAQPLVERFSQNLDTANNFIQMDSTLNGPVGLTPSSATVRRRKSEGSIAVQANVPNFSWTAVSDSGWLTVTGGASGGGNGMVTYSVAPNRSDSPRTGTITVAGVAFRLMQAGRAPAQ
jgi:hypothetical protein